MNIITKDDGKVYLLGSDTDYCVFEMSSDPDEVFAFMIMFKDIANILMGADEKLWLTVDKAAAIMAINGSKEFFNTFKDHIIFYINGEKYYLAQLPVPTYIYACYAAVAKWFESYKVLEAFKHYVGPIYKDDVMKIFLYCETLMQGKSSLDEVYRQHLEARIRGTN